MPCLPLSSLFVCYCWGSIECNCVKCSEDQPPEGISLPQCIFQQIINKYDEATSFIVRIEESSVDNLVLILHNLGNALDWRLLGIRAWRTSAVEVTPGDVGKISIEMGCQGRLVKTTWHPFWPSIGDAKC